MAHATVSLAGTETPVMMTSMSVTKILVDNTPTAPTLQAALTVHVLLVTPTTQAWVVEVQYTEQQLCKQEKKRFFFYTSQRIAYTSSSSYHIISFEG